MSREIKNMAASVRQRLLNLSRKWGEDFQALATRYAIERFLYRLSVSEHRDSFVLKGAMLFAVWAEMPNRPTRDLDLLGFVDDDYELIGSLIADICCIEYADGLSYDPDTIEIERIRDEQEYHGVRIKLKCNLAEARLSLQVDVGFGDAMNQGAEELDYPVIIKDFAKPRLRVYRVETVIAEKLQAMVSLGMTNSRMKDYYDLWTISNVRRLNGDDLLGAVQATFERRGTAIPTDLPIGLSDEFAEDAQHQRYWEGFLTSKGLPKEVDLRGVVSRLREFLLPVLEAVRREDAFTAVWDPQGLWK